MPTNTLRSADILLVSFCSLIENQTGVSLPYIMQQRHKCVPGPQIGACPQWKEHRWKPQAAHALCLTSIIVHSPSSTITKHLSSFLRPLTDLEVSGYCGPTLCQEVACYNNPHSACRMQDSDKDTRGVGTRDVEHLKSKGAKKNIYIYIYYIYNRNRGVCTVVESPPAENKLMLKFFYSVLPCR